MLGGNDGAHAVLVASKTMIGFRVVSCVGSDLQQSNARHGLSEERTKLVDVRTWTAPGASGEDEMAVGVANHSQLGKMMINHGFPGLGDAGATANEVPASRAAFQTCGVDRRALDSSSATQMHANGGVQKVPGRSGFEQSLGGFFHCGEVGNAPKFQHLYQRRMIGQMRS